MENKSTKDAFLQHVISNIKDVDYSVMEKAKERLDSLAKPLGSLGILEDLCIKLAGITGVIRNEITKKAIIIMCADNGVVEEGIASGPQSLTLAQTINFTKGLTGVAVLAKQNNTDLIVVDVGINSDKCIEKVINRKISKGTKNILKGQAMHRHQCITALNIGIEMSKKSKKEGYSLVGVGEMGNKTVKINLNKTIQI